jgi:hypothetical protein
MICHSTQLHVSSAAMPESFFTGIILLNVVIRSGAT